jgi:hypothetical protein
MAFRDDHAAALARADALQAELDRIRRERTPTPQPPHPVEKPRPRREWVGRVIAGLAFLFPFLLVFYCFHREAAEEQARDAKRGIAGCLDRLDVEIRLQRDGMPDRFDPAHDQVIPRLPRSVAIECTELAMTIARDDDLPADARGILENWGAAERALDEPLAKLNDYYQHRDWEEDDMRGARTIWKRLEPLLAQRDAMVKWAREAALPKITASN